MVLEFIFHYGIPIGISRSPSVIHKSMDNAIVLLVLALGEICSWKEGFLGPALHPDQRLSNMGGVPGVAYYVVASDILGTFQGDYSLGYIRACLLAALYAGQLAHPFCSHAWISQAVFSSTVKCLVSFYHVDSC